ncbi:TlpA family protein disulfide reductase [Mucilaginibacter jinjuensis]|uniref:TlpA disulfide reductase family protein n=1 Tax=Mucilaginibacter jinjuensis TaxID=1176721 RepID=A0ABY7TDM4_9SPHI|nr:TlpA disulfide reductase family protein [Mucilaginibacter jinjuensis]WCT13267.1 TlpA disulfide reductase family protein [Mucilaginibacter jinjuensis]
MKYLFFYGFVLASKILFRRSAHAPVMPADTIPFNQAAPDFSLKDFNGKTVFLSSFKGKVVILYFWATWCGPCHENFLVMQKAVTHYKSDKKVVFLFIDTKERSEEYVRLAKEDMAKLQYNFQVLFNEKGADGKQNKYSKIFGISGIPTEFILDSKGIIKHRSDGYDPELNNDQRAEELIKQIELVKTSL